MLGMATAPSVDDLEKKEEELFRTGPLSVLTMSVKNNSQARFRRITSFHTVFIVPVRFNGVSKTYMSMTTWLSFESGTAHSGRWVE